MIPLNIRWFSALLCFPLSGSILVLMPDKTWAASTEQPPTSMKQVVIASETPEQHRPAVSPPNILVQGVGLPDPGDQSIAEPPMLFRPPDPPSEGRTVGRSRGGASRSSGRCGKASSLPLTALVPASQRNSEDRIGQWEQVWSLTTSDMPPFWFYVPYALEGNVSVQFVLMDQQSNILHKTTLTPTLSAAGVLKMPLPDSVPPLQAGEQYHWFFLVYCNEENPEYVEGWVERTVLDADMQATMATADARDQAALYAAAGIWQDALNQLAELRLNHPNDAALTADWTTLLSSAGLTAIAEEPLLNCCDF